MKVVYYSDPLRDDFAGNDIKNDEVTEHYRYIHKNIIWRVAAFLLYYVIACPLVFLYCKFFYSMKIIGKENIAKIGKGGFFIYGNHTHTVDSFIPHLLSVPKRRGYIIASPDAVSIPGLRTIVPMLGTIPIPTTVRGMKIFLSTIKKKINDGSTVAIYPEAHLWPYYIGIRPFTEKSFYYPVKMNAPIIAFCNTYSRRKVLRFIHTPRMTLYISEPMYPDTSMPLKEAQSELRERVYQFMNHISMQYSKYEYVRYLPKDAVSDDEDN